MEASTIWTNSEVLAKANWLLDTYAEVPARERRDFRKFASQVAYVVKSLPAKTKAGIPWLVPWAREFAELFGDFDRALKADPMLAYQPQTEKHAAFHNSPAYIRYAMCANGTGKTQMGYAEHYYTSTGQPLLGKPRTRGNTAVISVGYGTYAIDVFGRKFLSGEDGNALSPIFPEDGYWFHSYDKKQYTIRVACPDCAKAGRPRKCSHTVAIKCFSDSSGWERFQGGTYQYAQIDEHCDENWFKESRQRTRRGTVKGFIGVTGTPLFGEDAWEVTQLLRTFEGPPSENKVDLTDPESPPWVDVFMISKYEAGFLSKGEIDAERKKMTKADFQARVMGMPVPMAQKPVFDYENLEVHETNCEEPSSYGSFETATAIEHVVSRGDIAFVDIPMPDADSAKRYSGWRIWEPPVDGAKYAISVDTALGLARGDGAGAIRDPSCADVWKMEPLPDGTIKIHQVAQLHGWIDPFDYADQIKLGAIHYNYALVIPENTGVSMMLVGRLTKQILYPNVYRDRRTPEYVENSLDGRSGVDTNKHTKPLMIAAGQRYLEQNNVVIRCKDTIREMRAFEEEKTDLGNPRYRGASGAKDDRVMSYIICCYPLSIDGGMVYMSGVSLERPKLKETPWYQKERNDGVY